MARVEIYLIRHAEVDYTAVTDPSVVRLTANGSEQARRVAEHCVAWGIQFLCASTMVRAEMTADAISARLPGVLRWDLDELQEMNPADLEGYPNVPPLVSAWPPELFRLGLERTWIRVMAAWARIRIYAETYGIDRVALVSHAYPIRFLILNWLGHDWRANDRFRIPVDMASSSHITLGDGDTVHLDWLNRLP